MAKYLYVKSKYVSVRTLPLSKTLQNPNQNVYLNLFPHFRKPKKEIQQNSNCNTSVGSFSMTVRQKSCFQHFYKKPELLAYLGTWYISMKNRSLCKFCFICVLSVCICICKTSHKLCEKILQVRCMGGMCECLNYDQMITML